jgi:hypothetical protein
VRTFAGTREQAGGFGYVQVKIEMTGTRLTDITMLEVTSEPNGAAGSTSDVDPGGTCGAQRRHRERQQGDVHQRCVQGIAAERTHPGLTIMRMGIFRRTEAVMGTVAVSISPTRYPRPA